MPASSKHHSPLPFPMSEQMHLTIKPVSHPAPHRTHFLHTGKHNAVSPLNHALHARFLSARPTNLSTPSPPSLPAQINRNPPRTMPTSMKSHFLLRAKSPPLRHFSGMPRRWQLRDMHRIPFDCRIPLALVEFVRLHSPIKRRGEILKRSHPLILTRSDHPPTPTYLPHQPLPALPGCGEPQLSLPRRVPQNPTEQESAWFRRNPK